MKSIKIPILIVFCLGLNKVLAQSIISGKVSDEKGNAFLGANVYLKGGYDGVSTIDDGSFSFKTDEKGEVTVVASVLGYETQEKKIIIEGDKVVVNLVLREKSTELNTVTISAGAFEASDEKKIVMLAAAGI